jgi:hypothetical protein
MLSLVSSRGWPAVILRPGKTTTGTLRGMAEKEEACK